MLPHRLVRGLTILCLAIAVACALFGIVNDIQRIRVVHQLDYEEGNVLNAAVRITNGLTPYPDPHNWPVVINPYGPLPYYLTAIPVRLFGPSFAPARALVIMSAIVCALLLGLIVHHLTRSSILAVTFAAIFLSQPLVQGWMAVLRVDFIALVFVLAGIYFFLRYPQRWMISVLVLSFAVFTKFSFLAGPAACFTFLMIQKEWRRALLFAAGIAATLLAFFGTAQLVTHGVFAFDVLFSHVDPLVWIQIPIFYYLTFLNNPFLFLIALAALVFALLHKSFSLPVLYWIFAIIGTASAVKSGSSMNHMIELMAATCILAATFLAPLLPNAGPKTVTASVLYVLVAGWMLLQVLSPPSTAPLPACLSYYRAIADSKSDRILSEDVGALVVNHKSVWVSNPFVYAQLAMAGKLSDAPLQQRVRDKWFDYIIVGDDPRQPSPRWSPQVQHLILDNYALIATTSCGNAVFILTPKTRQQPTP